MSHVTWLHILHETEPKIQGYECFQIKNLSLTYNRIILHPVQKLLAVHFFLCTCVLKHNSRINCYDQLLLNSRI